MESSLTRLKCAQNSLFLIGMAIDSHPCRCFHIHEGDANFTTPMVRDGGHHADIGSIMNHRWTYKIGVIITLWGEDVL